MLFRSPTPPTHRLPPSWNAERTTALARRLSSPVFISTSPDDGSRALGLGHIPTSRPLLFVGNHQTLALDLGMLCEQLLRERGLLLRGLAHPVIFADSFGGGGGGEQGEGEGSSEGGASANGSGNGTSSSNGSGGSGGRLAPWDLLPTLGSALNSGGSQGLEALQGWLLGGGAAGPGGRAQQVNRPEG